MTTAEIITEMQTLMRQRAKLQDQLSRARNAATATGGIGDGQPRTRSQDPKVERCGILCADLERQIDIIDQKLALYSEDVRRPIAAILDRLDAEVLHLRYVDRLSVRAIAERMHYHRTAMYNLLDRAQKQWLA